MAKRIKDKRKRTVSTLLKEDRELNHHRIKLIKAFPIVKDRLEYLKELIKEMDKPSDPILVEGGYPELGVV